MQWRIFHGPSMSMRALRRRPSSTCAREALTLARTVAPSPELRADVIGTHANQARDTGFAASQILSVTSDAGRNLLVRIPVSDEVSALLQNRI